MDEGARYGFLDSEGPLTQSVLADPISFRAAEEPRQVGLVLPIPVFRTLHVGSMNIPWRLTYPERYAHILSGYAHATLKGISDFLRSAMSFLEVIDLCSDDETGEAEVNIVKQEPGLDQNIIQHKRKNKADCAQKHTLTYHGICQESPANGSLNAPHTGKSSPAVLGQVESVTNVPSCASKLPPAPLCRQFWKAGNYDDEQVSKLQLQSGQNHLRVHPKFLHSNATSHKWAFGAIAELLDNALDEVQNGASFVVVDKIVNPKDASPALLIHDDGGGMDPESMRRCMSFGFSAKKLKSAIGQYGNGFKTSTMRLGADVIVFSRHASKRTLTQSVGLLSYTFLRQTGHGRIVVPIVDYEFEPATGKLINSHSAENSSANLSVLLEWSPFGTETELLKQFDNMGHHGTKVIIYNLWCSDDGDLELDFESDPEDILIAGAPKIVQSSRQAKMISQHHIANRFPYSLRVYSSILYLKIPNHFRIILRGKVVEHHNLANDLKFPEFILYKPQIGGKKEGSVITTIGFLKEAPHVNIHGFSVYHKNRLILPFFRVVSQTNNRGRGVIGVLEADFIEPTHNKQDFEKTSLFQKLEARLKDMTLEYWDFHCGLIGYQQQKKISTARPPHSKASMQPVTMNPSSPILTSPRVASVSRQGESLASPVTSSMQGPTAKRKGPIHPLESERLKRQATTEENAVNDKRHHWEAQTANGIGNGLQDHEVENLTQENKKLHAQCLEYEKKEEELNEKAELLRLELGEVQREYERLLTEAAALEITVKEEKT